MKIVLMASLLYPFLGGPEKLVFQLAGKYAELGHDVYVMTYMGADKSFYSNCKFKVILFPFLRTKKLKYMMKHIFSVSIINKLISIKPDIIHIHDTPFVFSSMIYKKLFHNCPVVLTSHCFFDRTFPLVYRILFGMDLKFADVVATVGTQMKKDIKNLYGVKSFLIPLCINTEEYKKKSKKEILRIKRKYNIPADRKIILTLGRIAKQKNLELTINSVAEIIKRDKNILFVIGGSGEKSYIKSLIELMEKLNIKKYVKMIGSVPEEEITAVYSMADLFLTTTLWETVSIASMEALSCSIPVVSTNAGSMKDVIINGYNGFLSNKREPKEIAEKSLLALKNKKPLSINARKIIKEKFSIDAVSKKYIQFYKGLINKNKIK